MNARPIAVVGAGWSGLAAATRLIERGQHVTVLEAARETGGRARGAEIGGLRLDNGQHLLLGAYRDTLAAMRRVAADPATAFSRQRLVLDLRGPHDRFRLALPPGPPRPAMALAMLTATGIPPAARLRAMSTASRLLRIPVDDYAVADWLRDCGQPAALVHRLWAPLCLAALNMPAEQASARLFARVLSEAFAVRGAADVLFPRRDLGALFPRPAVRWLQRNGARVHCSARVRAITPLTDGWRLRLRHGEVDAAGVVIATGAPATARLLAPLGAAPSRVAERLGRLDVTPITTVWLRRRPGQRSLPAMHGRLDGPAQWVFDRTLTGHPGILAAVISGDGPHMALGREALGAEVARQLADHGTPPEVVGVVRDKRATFSAHAGVERYRPGVGGLLPGLWLAGDHVANGLPATIEGAVRNGHQCADTILREIESDTT